MCTAMAASYKNENRDLDSAPYYRFATGTLTVRYTQPTPSNCPLILKAQVLEIKGKKVTLDCQVYAEGKLTRTKLKKLKAVS